ncbi:MAG: DUF1737 domain-containing protein [Acidobacteria bacterium]|jgi:hypothetical protein|nr:DUF1737 domain-containing protein [Acidobacteriota bacterium]
MTQIHEYELLSATYPAELSEAVNRRLAEGWSLCGSPFASGDEVFQAVVRATKPDDKRLRRKTSDARPSE